MSESDKIVRARIEIHRAAGGTWSRWEQDSLEQTRVEHYGPYVTLGAVTARINEAKRAAQELNAVRKVGPGDPGYITVTGYPEIADPLVWKAGWA